MSTITITTVYDSETRELRSQAVLDGFIEALPDRAVIGEQFDTLTLYGDEKLTAADQANIIRSATRALQSANLQLVRFHVAGDVKYLADELLATADSDPVASFDDTLAIGAPVDPAGTFDNTIVNPPPAAPI